MKCLDINEIHDHLLGIAKEFDRICVKHNIPYYMIGGTMLGAIRHKGFIPWDDDMDFGVPIEYYKKLIDILEEELSYPYRCCTYNNHPAVIFNYFKIEDRNTFISSEVIKLAPEQQIGINIDVFPLNKCREDDPAWKKINNETILLGGFVSSKMHSHSLIRKFVKMLLRLIAGGSHIKVNKRIDSVLLETNQGDYLANLLGRWGKSKEMILMEWFGKGNRYQFENISLLGPKNYDKYLSHIYGDYMKLPSQDDRKPHVENVFLR